MDLWDLYMHAVVAEERAARSVGLVDDCALYYHTTSNKQKHSSALSCLLDWAAAPDR